MIKCKIKDIVTLSLETLVPQEGIAYHLYSLPSFDEGRQREEVMGEDIGSNKFIVPDKCILFNKLNVRFKRVWRIDNTDNNKLASTEFLPLIVDEEKVDFQYCYYLLISDSITKYLSGQTANTSGSHKRISPDDFLNIEVALPEMTEQKRIGGFLSSIDRKIDVNQALNQDLENLTKQIYDYWFVQFDFPDENGRPYKSSGGKMVWNETLKREIPEGWEVCNLYRIAKFTNGLACQKYRPKEGESSLPVIKIKEMHEGISPETERVSSSIPESVKIYDGDILFSWSASLEVMLWAYGEGGLNQHIFKVTPKDGFPKSYVFFQLLHYIVVFRAMAEARKTTMGHITTDHIMQSRICIPTESYLYENFENEMEPFFEKFITNSKEIIQLQSLRSYLLPLLMTGQAKLKNKDDN